MPSASQFSASSNEADRSGNSLHVHSGRGEHVAYQRTGKRDGVHGNRSTPVQQSTTGQ